eukprot:tig00000391_g24831.t1
MPAPASDEIRSGWARSSSDSDASQLAAALAAGAASGASGSAKAANSDRDDLSESSVSNPRRHNNRHGRSATEFLAASAFDGSGAVRSLRRAIAASCLVLLVLLVVLCSVSIQQMEQQGTAIDRVSVVSALRTLVLEAVDGARSMALIASAASAASAAQSGPAGAAPASPPPGFSPAAAAAKRSGESLLASARQLYFASDRAAHNWGVLTVAVPVYLPAPDPAAQPTVSTLRISLWDAAGRFGERAVQYAALAPNAPAVANAATNPTFRFLCDAGLGGLASGLARLSDAYEEASRSYLRTGNVLFAALAGSVLAVGLVVGLGVFQPGLRRVARNKLNMADVVTRIPSAVVKEVSKHYGTVRLLASSSDEEGGAAAAAEAAEDASDSDEATSTERDEGEEPERGSPQGRIVSNSNSTDDVSGLGLGLGPGLLHSAGPGVLNGSVEEKD